MPVKPGDLDTIVHQLGDFVDAVTAEVARLGDRLEALADLAYQSHRRSPVAEEFRNTLLSELERTDTLEVAATALRATLYGLTGAVPAANPVKHPPAERRRRTTKPGDPFV